MSKVCSAAEAVALIQDGQSVGKCRSDRLDHTR